MKKILNSAILAIAGVSCALAQQAGSTILDTTQLESNLSQVSTDLTTFLSSKLGPFVVTIGGAAFLIFLGMRIWRWAARALTSGRG